MNPLPIVFSMIRRNVVVSAAFVLLVALAVGIGGAITAQERALRSGSARAADRFDLVVAAPGSQTDMLLKVVFLQPGDTPLLEGEPLRRLMSDTRAAFVAPIGFGDSHEGAPVVGTIAAFVDHLGDGVIEGRVFEHPEEAVVGAASPLGLGDSFQPAHGRGELIVEHSHHSEALTVVGRLPPTGSPWDSAILVPIEFVWEVHGLLPHEEGEEEHGEEHGIGPPFDLDHMPGIPAAVVHPETFAAAYGLRSEYRTSETMAFFPAEVLVEIYALLGDVRMVMSVLAVATEALLIAAILTGIVILMRLYRQRFAVLRALGASRLYVVAVVWSFSFALIAMGSVLGLGVAAGLAGFVSHLFAQSSGIALDAGIGATEVGLAATIALVGALLSVLPALALYREGVTEALRGG
jgi:putative ABC transport system permease protein